MGLDGGMVILYGCCWCWGLSVLRLAGGNEKLVLCLAVEETKDEQMRESCRTRKR